MRHYVRAGQNESNGAVEERSVHRQISAHKLTGSTVISVTCSDEVPECFDRFQGAPLPLPPA